ncbi:MAG TPA: hypothetical protein VFP10_01325 [Candidatus Eisenbacteria bacterium]|nr:hypothetical protein [Candidatus Eisenbacteria bacterium]
MSKTEYEFEIEFMHDTQNAAAGVDAYHLHLRCFAAWEFERTKPSRTVDTGAVQK